MSRRRPWGSLAVLAVLVLGCLFAEALLLHDPSYLDLSRCSLPPCREYPFGTDSLGRDLFSAIWYGGRVSLGIGAAATALSTGIALVYGTASGLTPAWLDALLMRLAELCLSLPSLLVLLFLQAIWGQASPLSLAVVIGATGWMSMAKLVRAEVRRLRCCEYMTAARALGAGFSQLLARHLAPNLFSSLLFMVVMQLRTAILTESTLSFLGFGLPLEVLSWGSMLSLAEGALLSRAWWVILIPGAFLVTLLVCVTRTANWLRDRALPGGNLL